MAQDLNDLPEVAADIAGHLDAANFEGDPRVRQILALAKEVGEFVGAARRWLGMARRPGPFTDVETELADVVLTAFVTAHALGVDLPAAITAKLTVIYNRGWRQQVTADG